MLLLFDLDGTLTDSRIGIVRCFVHALQQIGRPSADSYLRDEASIRRALGAICGALHPGGLLALDICDLKWGET